MKKLILAALAPSALAFCAVSLPAGTAMADDGWHRGHGHERHWRGDIRMFHEHDLAYWRGGRWFHGHHGGRLGWWWIVGGVWYFYPAPVYPYPDPYAPPVLVQPSPPVYVEQAPPAPAQALPPPPPAQYWYYCRKPEGYYPYVPSCRLPWEKVPATPVR